MAAMLGWGVKSMDWETDGADWPHRGASHFVEAGGLRWHVQRMGHGPVWLLLHGTGAATHSWRGLMPLLARHATVVAPDLPGHGFSGALPGRPTLPAMADALAQLLQALKLPPPQVVVGHSAGAAIGARLVLDGACAPRSLLALNGAFLPFDGLAGLIFPPLARLLALNPLVPWFFSWRAVDDAAVRRLVASTGSQLDDTGLALYGRLLRSPAHVSGALAMMAHWDLHALWRELPQLPCALGLVAAERDATVPPAQADEVAQRLPGAQVRRLVGLGHLAHEEAPQAVADLLQGLARELRAAPPLAA